VETNNPSYRVLHFLVRYGDWFAAVVGLAPIIIGVCAWGAGMSIAFAIAGAFGSIFLYVIMRSYIELVRVIVDMLLPK